MRYTVPQGGDGNAPVVMVHGATLTGESWETTRHRAHAAQPVDGSKRILDAVARAGRVHASVLRGVGHRLRPVLAARVQFLTGAVDANTRFADGDIRNVESRFSPEHLPDNLALVTCRTRSANQIRFTPSERAELNGPLPRLKATSG